MKLREFIGVCDYPEDIFVEVRYKNGVRTYFRYREAASIPDTPVEKLGQLFEELSAYHFHKEDDIYRFSAYEGKIYVEVFYEDDYIDI
jgi:hypothetical protein